MYISIDLGGTNTRVSSSKNLQEIYKVEKYPSPDDVKDLQKAIRKSINEVTDGESVKAVSVGIPGTLDKENKKIILVPNYQVLNDVEFDNLVNLGSDVPTFFNNDAALAGLGESVLGSGKEFDVVAYITLSTGVGGVRIENKTLTEFQKMSEPGRCIINMDANLKDEAQVRGSFEAYASGTGFEKIFGIKPEDCEDPEVWSDYGYYLFVGLVNVTSMWAPDVIVLGGSLTKKFELFYSRLKLEMEKFSAFEFPKIKKSMFMDDSGLMGGLVYIQQHI